MNDFTIYRGEAKTKKLTVYCNDEEYQLKANEYYQMEIYDGDCRREPILTKQIEQDKIYFVKEDTINLKKNSYPYLIKLMLPNDEFIVVVDKSFLTLI